MRSPWGRVVKSIRENETAAISLGKPVFLYKMQSLIVGGLVGSLAGVVLALSQQDVNPETFMPIFTFFAYTALILGGVGRIWGPVVGAFIFWAILAATDSVMAQLSSGILVSSLSGQVTASVRFVLVGRRTDVPGHLPPAGPVLARRLESQIQCKLIPHPMPCPVRITSCTPSMS